MTWRDDLARLTNAVPSTETAEAIGELEAARARLWARLLEANGAARPHRAEPEEWLTAEAAAKRFHVSRSCLYEHKKELGARQFGRAVRFPARGIQRYLDARRPQ